jgi:DNA-binding SARP family transcriptional activator
LVRTDVDEFRTAALLLQESTDARSRRAAAETMVSLARGEFLTELRYEDWVADAQASVHAELRLHLLPVARGEVELPEDMGIRAASALISLDRYDEEAHLALVDRLLESGRRLAAREALRRFAQLLANELDEEPTPRMLTALALVRLDPEEVKQNLTSSEEGLTLRANAL